MHFGARWLTETFCCSSVDSSSQHCFSPLYKEVCMCHLVLGLYLEELDQELGSIQELEESLRAINQLKLQ